MATAADVVVGCLEKLGARRIFGVPGEGSSLDLIEAARVRHMDFVTTQHAAAAVIMAATEGDLAGRPGACVIGPDSGAAEAAAAVGHAFLQRLPLVVFTESYGRSSQRLGSVQPIDNKGILRYVTKDSATLTGARADRLVVWAWEKASAGPAGPVHLDLPADEALAPSRRRPALARVVRRTEPSASAIRKIARLLSRGGRAVVLAGLGCREPEVGTALRELVEHLGAPTLTTPRAKGALSEDHPLAAGVFSGGRLSEELLSRAECLLTVGLDSTEAPALGRKAGPTVLSIAPYRTTLCPFEPAAEAIGALAPGLILLRENLPPAGDWNFAAWARRGAAFRERTRSLLADACRLRGVHGLAPHRVVEIARDVFPKPTLATVDTGAHALATVAFWETYEPKAFLCSVGSASIGYALPAAIAAKLVSPDRPVVAFMGDSGFLLNLAEVTTANRVGAAVVVIVFVDESLSLARVAQEQKRYAPAAVSVSAVDIPKVAEGLGALGTTVETEEELRVALSDALGTTKPAIIAAKVNPQGYRRMLEVLRGKGER
jgi:acetolactate synthase-1/2/3 large subunit